MNNYWTQVAEKAEDLGLSPLDVHNRGLVSTSNRCDDCGKSIDRPAAVCPGCIVTRMERAEARDPINIARRQGCLIVMNDGKSKMDRNISHDYDGNDPHSPANVGV